MGGKVAWQLLTERKRSKKVKVSPSKRRYVIKIWRRKDVNRRENCLQIQDLIVFKNDDWFPNEMKKGRKKWGRKVNEDKKFCHYNAFSNWRIQPQKSNYETMIEEKCGSFNLSLVKKLTNQIRNWIASSGDHDPHSSLSLTFSPIPNSFFDLSLWLLSQWLLKLNTFNQTQFIPLILIKFK